MEENSSLMKVKRTEMEENHIVGSIDNVNQIIGMIKMIWTMTFIVHYIHHALLMSTQLVAKLQKLLK